jgi:hypothetical protein
MKEHCSLLIHVLKASSSLEEKLKFEEELELEEEAIALKERTKKTKEKNCKKKVQMKMERT